MSELAKLPEGSQFELIFNTINQGEKSHFTSNCFKTY
jgi:hypothetical protein